MDRKARQEGQPRLRNNDYTTLRVPTLGEWEPRLRASVVIPTFNSQATLALVLAALAAQSYPEQLFEVIVVDDGSDPPVELPDLVPKQTRVVSSSPDGWGSAHAFHTGVEVADGEVILRLDSDVIPRHDHVEAHLRWHHLADYLVVVGSVTIVESGEGEFSPQLVFSAASSGGVARLFDGKDTVPSWVETVIEETRGLVGAGNRAYRIGDGANLSFSGWLYREAGGIDANLRLGSDTELAYRLSQVGAVFIPESGAGAWHLGRTQMEARKEDGRRYRLSYLSQRIPVERSWRRDFGRQWEVPYVDVVVEAKGRRYEDVCATVNGVLASTLSDVRVTLLAPWSSIPPQGRTVLDDPFLELRLLRASYGTDNRVTLAEYTSPTSFPAPFRFVCPAGLVPAVDALRRLVDVADKGGHGLLHVAYPLDGGLLIARLERTEAFARALHVAERSEELDTVVGQISGFFWLDGSEWALATAESAVRAPSVPHLYSQLQKWKRVAGQRRADIHRLQRGHGVRARLGARLTRRAQAALAKLVGG